MTILRPEEPRIPKWLPELNDFWRDVAEVPSPRWSSANLGIRLSMGGTNAYDTAVLVSTVEREMRRASAVVASSGRNYRPLPVDRGGLAAKDAAVGSLDFVFDIYGTVATVLQSSPVQAIITLDWFLNKASQLPSRLRPHRRRPIEAMTVVQEAIENNQVVSLAARDFSIEAKPGDIPPRLAALVEHEADAGRAVRVRSGEWTLEIGPMGDDDSLAGDSD